MIHQTVAIIFRVWCGYPHTVIALMPDLPADMDGRFCTSYEHIGQHGGADYNLVISRTRPALLAEYAALKTELESAPYGYQFRIYRRRQLQNHCDYPAGLFVGAGIPKGKRSNTFVECGCCGSYHRADFTGDCREDSERFEDLPFGAVLSDNSPEVI